MKMKIKQHNKKRKIPNMRYTYVTPLQFKQCRLCKRHNAHNIQFRNHDQ